MHPSADSDVPKHPFIWYDDHANAHRFARAPTFQQFNFDLQIGNAPFGLTSTPDQFCRWVPKFQLSRHDEPASAHRFVRVDVSTVQF
jgi:hypothetical protein